MTGPALDAARTKQISTRPEGEGRGHHVVLPLLLQRLLRKADTIAAVAMVAATVH